MTHPCPAEVVQAGIRIRARVAGPARGCVPKDAVRPGGLLHEEAAAPRRRGQPGEKGPHGVFGSKRRRHFDRVPDVGRVGGLCEIHSERAAPPAAWGACSDPRRCAGESADSPSSSMRGLERQVRSCRSCSSLTSVGARQTEYDLHSRAGNVVHVRPNESTSVLGSRASPNRLTGGGSVRHCKCATAIAPGSILASRPGSFLASAEALP